MTDKEQDVLFRLWDKCKKRKALAEEALKEMEETKPATPRAIQKMAKTNAEQVETYRQLNSYLDWLSDKYQKAPWDD